MANDTKVIDDTESEVIPLRYSIASYGADYAVETLVQRLNKDIMFVPEFQRKFVWSLPQASRFLESLILGLPVPGVFLAKEDSTGKLLIIDGQQRLRSVQAFVNGTFRGKVFALESVQPRLEGKTYQTLSDMDRNALNDSVIHATVIRQESPTDDQSSIYHVFQRLNTGGTLLQPQEIRACIFHGKFDELLKKLNKNPSWRHVFGKQSPRLKDEELILRFLAFRHDFDGYTRPMSGFLNTFMGKYKNLTVAKANEFEREFTAMIELVDKSLGKKAFRPEKSFNAAVFDSVSVAIAKSISRNKTHSPATIASRYAKLLTNKAYLEAVNKSTGNDASVVTRFTQAETAFK